VLMMMIYAPRKMEMYSVVIVIKRASVYIVLYLMHALQTMPVTQIFNVSQVAEEGVEIRVQPASIVQKGTV